MRTSILILAAALTSLLAASSVPAEEGPLEEGRKKFESKPLLPHEKYQLDNGLTVILHENHKLPQVVTNLWYHVGTREEPKGRSGFAHLFEHLMFMGTTRVPDSQFDQLMESGGGANNASTWFDRTNYFDWGPAKLLPTLLWLEADRMEGLSAAMTQKKLDLQRDVVRNERREGYDNAPYGPSNYLFYELVYPTDHPYHYHVIGSHEDLVAATVQDVKDFYDTYYIPNNATLVVAGAFDSTKVKPLIEGLFGSIPRGKEPPRRSAPSVGFERIERVTLTDKVQFPRVTMAWHSPSFYRPGDAEMDLTAFALGTGKNGRLYKRLVRDEQLAIDVSVGQTSLRLGSVFRLDVYAKPGSDLARIEAIVDEELTRFHRDGPTERELQRGRAEFETSTISELESIRDVADLMNRYDAHLGRPDAVRWDLARYTQATPEGVRDCARKFLRLDRRLIMRVIPKGKPDATLPTRDKRPDDFPQPPFTAPVPEAFTLANGLTVWHMHRPGVPLMAARMVMPGGTIAQDPAEAGVAALAADLMTEGAGDLDALQFADALAVLGASLSASAGSEATQMNLSVLQRNADKALGLMARALREPRFQAASFTRQRGLALQGLKQLLDDPGTLARRVSMEAYFGKDSRYATPAGGYPATVEKLTLAQVKAHHARWHSPSGATLLTAGDMTTAQVKALVEKHFAAWTSTSARPAISHNAAPQPKTLRVVVVDRPDAAQTVVRFLHPGIGFEHQDRIGLEVLNTIFGGSFTSRLNANLREKHGYTYGAGSGFSTMSQRGLFVASSNIQTDKTGAGLTEFFREFDLVRTGGVTAGEARKARETVRAEITQSFETLSGVIGAYTPYALHRVDPATLPATLGQADGSDAAALSALAKDWIARDGGVLILVGDRKAIDPQLAALKLAKPRYLSPAEALAGAAAR